MYLAGIQLATLALQAGVLDCSATHWQVISYVSMSYTIMED